jgi:hypothetical protein
MVASSTPLARSSALRRTLSLTTLLADAWTSLVASTPLCCRCLNFSSRSATYSFCRNLLRRLLSLRRSVRSGSCGLHKLLALDGKLHLLFRQVCPCLAYQCNALLLLSFHCPRCGTGDGVKVWIMANASDSWIRDFDARNLPRPIGR